MPVSYKLITNLKPVKDALEKFEGQVTEIRDDILKGMATEIVLNSPVDTGTYMESHSIGVGNAGAGPVSFSANKPRNQNYSDYANSAMAKLFGDIENLPEDADNIRIRNVAYHAPDVEYTHGYAPYTTARNKLPSIIAQAIQRNKT